MGWDLLGVSHETRRIDPAEIAANRAFFHKVDEMFLEGYDPTRDSGEENGGYPTLLDVAQAVSHG